MTLAIAVSSTQHRNDSTILPILNVSGYTGVGYIKLYNWQYFPVPTPSFPIIPENRSLPNCPISLRNLLYSADDWTIDTAGGGFSIAATPDTKGFARTGGSPDWKGAYYETELDGNIVSIQATAQSTQLSTGISLQDTPFASHNYLGIQVAHSIIFGQNGQLSIREFGQFPPISAQYRYEEGDSAMIEYDKINDIVRYYLIKDGKLLLMRTTRPKFTGNPTAEILLFHPGASLNNVLVCNGGEAKTTFENIGVARRKKSVQSYQKWRNQRTRISNGETIQLADGETQTTFANPKTQLRQITLTPKTFNQEGFLNLEDFFNWHGNDREFIFVDEARKDAAGNPQEFWAKFSGGMTDESGNGCVFDYGTQIIEIYRNDYVPRILDETAPSVTITSIVEGSAIISGTASDNVLIAGLQLFHNGQAYGDPFLPDQSGNWTITVPDEDLQNGDNAFFVIATDYAGKQTQSNTEIFSVISFQQAWDIGRPTGGTIGGYQQDFLSGGTLADYTGSTVDQSGEVFLLPDSVVLKIRYVTTSGGTAMTGTIAALTPNTWYRLRNFFYVNGGGFQTVISVNGKRELHHNYLNGNHVDNRDIVCKSNSSGELNISVIGEGAGTIADTGVLTAMQLLTTTYTTDARDKQYVTGGDSRTAGDPEKLTDGTYPNQFAVLMNANAKQVNDTWAQTYNPTKIGYVKNIGQGGWEVSSMLGQANAVAASLYDSSLSENWFIFAGGINDINAGHSGTDTYNLIVDTLDVWRDAGFSIVWQTIPTSSVTDLTKQTQLDILNNLIRSNYSSFPNTKLGEVASRTEFSNPNDATYFVNESGVKIHYTSVANGIVAQISKDAILSDSIAPTAPVMTTPTGVTSSAIAWHWTAATDNVAVTGYQLQIAEDGAFTSITATRNLGNVLTDNGAILSSGIPYYARVRAHDAANIFGAWSNTEGETTSAGVWYPTTKSGLLAWWQFSDASQIYQDSSLSTLVSANNDPIGGYNDKSSNNIDLIQPTSGLRTAYKTAIVNGKSVSRSNGTSYQCLYGALSASSLSAMSLYFVIKTGADVTTAQGIFTWAEVSSPQSGTPFIAVNMSSGAISIYINGGYRFTFSASANTSYQFSIRYDGTTWQARVNGTDLTAYTGGSLYKSTATNIYLHSSYPSTGVVDFAEVFIYDSYLSGTDDTSAKNYLRDEWAAY